MLTLFSFIKSIYNNNNNDNDNDNNNNNDNYKNDINKIKIIYK
jgi:hypothetical protein